MIIYGGGTVQHVRPHLALCAPAYGTAAKTFARLMAGLHHNYHVDLRLTKMAGGIGIETNEDLAEDIAQAVADPETRVIVMTAAVCDFLPVKVYDPAVPRDVNWMDQDVGKDCKRLSSGHGYSIDMEPADKLIGTVRKARKDIFLVACKTTTGATVQEQFERALTLLKQNSCNLVLANDLTTRVNMIVTPEMAAYEVGTNREATLERLAHMTLSRSRLSFSRTVVADRLDLLRWNDAPSSLRTVVDWLVERGAYQPFNNVTVGHFGWMPQSGVLYSSRRKHNFNRIEDRDLVRVEFTEDRPVAYGFKPSAGVRSQYDVLQRLNQDLGYVGYDCIVHFHCPLRPGKARDIFVEGEGGITVMPQWPFECGSHECGDNTANGMRMVAPGIQAVMLDQHGPNIVFHRGIDPSKVISFIDENFNLAKRAGAPM